ncbi:hypothetical protein L1987_14457 [Smallanthus sonchifolius]|uniref:Uncharacterized protein n=1 Tax=Smallanthus sonchifolius TaxID=185202 RepID=A0ACB9J6C4_9ASTR|nr:hypothetical protein L1987_14457 [Smallanthus sonchifolius]
MHMEQLFLTSFFILAGVTAAADDLTGSLCSTCLPICSSPPSTSMPPPSPPTVTFKPPSVPDSPPAVVSKPPPSPAPVKHAPPPPRFYYFDSPEAVAPPVAKSTPPPAYITLGGNNGGGGPPSPRLVYFPSTPAAGGGSAGQNGYPYPYYMYDSKAASSSYVGILWVLMLLLEKYDGLRVDTDRSLPGSNRKIQNPNQQTWRSEVQPPTTPRQKWRNCCRWPPFLSFTLDRLHKEPELLRVDTGRIRRQMQEVAVINYRSFISAADALVSIGDEVSSIDKHLESLIAEVPKLTSGCSEFIHFAEQILEKRKMNQILLANHSTLLDLLDIPQLMDTCVRNGNYDEALELEAFVSKLSTMHPKLPVIQALAAEVRQTTQSLLSQLLQKLRSNIQLPECLRIIGYLRRIGVYSEYEMRLQFLRCRESWLSGILDDLDQRNAYEYLKGMVNCHRMHLFDVVNQYPHIC